MRSNLGVCFGCWVTLLFTGCGSDSEAVPGPEDGGSPANVSAALFSSSACKRESGSQGVKAHLRDLRVIQDQDGLAGLTCVAWQRVAGGGLLLDLYNYEGACGATWTGDGAMAANGTLEIHVDNPGCAIARCGKCLYDWSLALPVALPEGQTVAVSVAVDTCAGQQATQYVSATLGSESTGIRCGLADYGALVEQAATLGTCGQAGMPCVGSLLCGSGGFSSTGTCGAGLVCDSSAAPDQPVCLVPCATSSDCPRPDVFLCQDGLCRPAG